MTEVRIRVGIRVRPMSALELERGSSEIIQADGEKNEIIANIPSKKNTFEYDWTFGPQSSQREVYNMICNPLLNHIFKGFNGTLFAYGQTGSGKTYTLSDMVKFFISEMFEKIENLRLSAESKVELKLSYVEIYNEECYDLLCHDRKKLELKENKTGETLVVGLQSIVIQNADHIYKLLRDALSLRSTASTAMNSQSSRSHAICTFYLRITNFKDNSVFVSKLHMVDLAGSERLKKTQATGETLQQGININKGLFALGNVITALASQSQVTATAAGHSNSNSNGNGGAASDEIKHQFVQYRESKLTRLLKDALGGNGMTVMLACVSPADINLEETLSTLSYASKASRIVNTVHVNQDHSEWDKEKILKEMEALQRENEIIRQENSRLKQLAQNNNRLTPIKFDGRKSLLKLAKMPRLSTLTGATATATTMALPRKSKRLSESSLTSGTVDIGEDGSGDVNRDGSSVPMDQEEEPEEMLPDEIDEGRHSSREEGYALYAGSDSRRCSLNGDLEEREGGEESESVDLSEEDIDRMLHMEEEEVQQMIDLAANFQTTIVSLKSEIASLETEKTKLTQKMTAGATTGGGSSITTVEKTKLLALLQEKNKELKEKMAELKTKEQLFMKVNQQREKAQSEASRLQSLLEDAKRRHVETEKVRRAEHQKYATERLLFQKAEAQGRKKELQNKLHVQDLERKISKKDQVLKAQFEARDLEAKKLKQLQQRRDLVQSMRKKGGWKSTTATSTTATATVAQGSAKDSERAAGSGGGGLGEALSRDRIDDLESWLKEEIHSEAQRECLRDEICKEFEGRAKASNQLRVMKQEASSSSNSSTASTAVAGGGSRTMEEELKQVAIKAMEDEVKSRSFRIAQKQGQLADLGTVEEKRRFSSFISPKENKVLLRFMFTKLTKDYPKTVRELEAKLSAQEHLNGTLRKQIQELKAWKLLKEQCTAASICEEDVPPNMNDVTLASLDDLDESFYPEDEDYEEDCDSDMDGHRARGKKKRGAGSTERNPRNKNTRKKARTSDQSASSDNSGGTTASCGLSSTASSEGLLVDPVEPLSDYTVKELKSYLKSQGLPVTGVKAALVDRVRIHLLSIPTPPVDSFGVDIPVS